MKSFAIILLLAIFSFNNMGHYFVFKLLQMEARGKMEKQIRKDLPDAKLHIIKIGKNDKEQPVWSWFESDLEFSYKGIMYDVVSTRTCPDLVYYYCITDTEESELNDTLDKLVQDNTAHSKKINHLEKPDNKLLFINSYASFTIKKNASGKGTVINLVKEASQSPDLDIVVPPPRLV